MNDPTFIALQSALDDKPDDWFTRLALADYYEETGRLLAAKTQRWLAKNEMFPQFSSHVNQPYSWKWWRDFTYYPNGSFQSLFWEKHARLLWGFFWPLNCNKCGYKTRHEAELALTIVLLKEPNIEDGCFSAE